MEIAADRLRPLEPINGQRGSIALVTQQTRQLGPLRCEDNATAAIPAT